jgi:hypothetical protein
MIEFIKHKKIDKVKWDECINHSINTLIYANSWYLDIACPRWNAIIIDNYKAVFPLPTKIKWGIKYIYPPFFIQQLGLFYTYEKYNTESVLTECLNKIPGVYQFIELNLNENNKINSTSSIKVRERKNFLLNLNDKYENLFKNYSKGLKGKVKQVKQQNFKIITTTDPAGIIELFRTNKSEDLKKLKESDYKKLKKLINTSIKNNCAEIKLIFLKNNLVAGAVFLFFKNRITYFFSATSDIGKKSGAMSMILDEMICENSNKPFIFDFEGSMVDSIAKFFKSFGSTESLYLQFKINRLPRIIRWIKD